MQTSHNFWDEEKLEKVPPERSLTLINDHKRGLRYFNPLASAVPSECMQSWCSALEALVKGPLASWNKILKLYKNSIKPKKLKMR